MNPYQHQFPYGNQMYQSAYSPPAYLNQQKPSLEEFYWRPIQVNSMHHRVQQSPAHLNFERPSLEEFHWTPIQSNLVNQPVHQSPAHLNFERPSLDEFHWTPIQPNKVNQIQHPSKPTTQPLHHINPMHHPANHVPQQPMQQPVKSPQQNTIPSNQYEYEYPPVDPNLLYKSANETKKLMSDASKVLDKLSSSKDFGSKVMYFAERSDIEEVKRLIKTTGIKRDVKIDYNPDGLRLEFDSTTENVPCCKLFVTLRWR